jgi:hypothetical protein
MKTRCVCKVTVVKMRREVALVNKSVHKGSRKPDYVTVLAHAYSYILGSSATVT